MRSNQEWLELIREQINPNFSDAAKYWDSLKPELRGVVLHAASVHGGEALSAHLAKCSWSELYARLDHRRMMQLRSGIQHARNLFAGFGSLRERDFAPRTAHYADHHKQPEVSCDMSSLPDQTAFLLASRNQLRQQITGGKA
ncbi:hypothetical protein R4I72_20445 [Leclercia adecarboxylata]|uniref:hypothetical protein n=1 Tax=Enterobacteriaceae TaxID=543 RepID=UPI0022E33D0C|nr:MULTISPECIES: hypothetical protein [Enterobacteriaceae]MDQ2129546.1 hypothetical protein [Leclercia adecarboxylata]MDV7059406.1 hypothetical protein [Leclercia adecarboxylata]